MKKQEFYKLQATGNDFILIDNRVHKLKTSELKKITKKYCQRKVSIGADGLLVVDSVKNGIVMRIINSDGTEAEMCGNGARCVAYWLSNYCEPKEERLEFLTQAGLIRFSVKGSNVKVKLTDPKQLKLDISLTILDRRLKVNFINTGVPHAVIFVQGLSKIDVEKIGRNVRRHKEFAPKGANVNFVEIVNETFLKIRTYERGVEAETLACGTGTVASAIIAGIKANQAKMSFKIKVLTKGKELLRVYFNKKGSKIDQVYLEGKVHCIYKGKVLV